MSTKILGQVWPLQMPPMCKSVLVSLADQANDEGVCWPEMEWICQRTCLHAEEVELACIWLSERRVIGYQIRIGRPTVYVITAGEFRSVEHPGKMVRIKGERWKRIRARVLKRDGFSCRRCSANSDLEIDHITPIAQGGTHNDDNLQVLCRSCHQDKTYARGMAKAVAA